MLTHLENSPHSFVTIFCQGKLNECRFVCKYLSPTPRQLNCQLFLILFPLLSPLSSLIVVTIPEFYIFQSFAICVIAENFSFLPVLLWLIPW